jgi:hypothetical protein
MTNELAEKPTAITYDELTKLFGPPPILSTENLEIYQAMAAHILRCVKPEDFVVLILVKDFINYEWEVLRLTRHKSWAIERKFRQRLEYQKSREKKLPPDTTKAPEAPASEAEAEAEAERVYLLHNVVETTFNDIQDIFKEKATEVQHADALEHTFGYYERVDVRLNIATAARNNCLRQIAQYRDELAQELQRAPDAFLWQVFQDKLEADAPKYDKIIEAPLVPAKEPAQ